MKYDGKLDDSCKELCDALNRLPGVETDSSCCGHGKNPYRIWLRMLVPSLGARVLTRCLSRRYYQHASSWNLHLGDAEDAAIFVLEGDPLTDGEDRPKADILAGDLLAYLERLTGLMTAEVYRVTSPRGKVYLTIKGLSLFCEQRGLTPSNMVKVANGERPNHKGWKCQRLDPAEVPQ